MLQVHNGVGAIEAGGKYFKDICARYWEGGLTSFLFSLLFRVPIADIFQTKKRRRRQVGCLEKIQKTTS